MTTNHIRNTRSLRGVLFSFLFFACACPVVAQEWNRITPPVANAPAVVEFFSFYCPPCYAFSQTLGVDKAIRKALPEGEQMIKYHVSQLGPLGSELTRAWALAIVMNMTEPVENALFKAQVENKINGAGDIRRIFMDATGLSAEMYDRSINSSEVNEMVALQERLFKEYGVSGTPSVYVKGQFHINNSAFQTFSVEDFRNRYATVVLNLLKNNVS